MGRSGPYSKRDRGRFNVGSAIRKTLGPDAVPVVPGVLIEERISVTQSSTVYRGRFGGQLVALKVIPVTSDEDTFVARFRKEVSAIGCISHPGIVKILDVGSGDGFVYLVTEFIEGESFAAVCAKGSHGKDDVVRAAKQVAGILAEIHRAGFVHRDIKPGNMILSRKEGLKLLDFGLVKSIGDTRGESQEAESEGFAGTLMYIAPEQAGLLKRGLDGRADLYSLGIVLYEYACGRAPFGGQDAMELLQKHLQLVPEPVETQNPEVGTLVSAIIAKLMAKDPDDRYQTADQLLADLEDLPALEAKLTALGPAGAAQLLGRKEPAFRARREVMVGREAEIEALKGAWHEAKMGRARVVIVEGESGLGKTRVCEEFLSIVEGSNALILRGKSHEFEHHPFGALNEAVTRFVTASVAQGTGELIGSSLGSMPELLPMLTTSLAPFLAEQTRRAESFADEALYFAVAEFLSNLFKNAGRPCVLYIDDIQWLKKNGRESLARLIDDAKGLPLLVLCAARGEAHHKPEVDEFKERFGRSKPLALQLARLSEAELGVMIASMLGGRSLVPSVLRRISVLADGNPYLAGQYLRILIDRGAIMISQGRCTVDELAMSKIGLSVGIQSLIMSRLEQLSGDASALLRSASVLGREFERGVLSKILEWGERRFEHAVRDALQSKIIEEAGKEKLAFVHDNLLESLSKGLEEGERQAIHRRAGLIFDAMTVGAGGDYERVFAAAYHYRNAGDPENPKRAFDLTYQAGRDAAKVHSHDQALEFLLFAYSLREKAGLSEQTQAEVCLELGKVYRRLSRIEEELGYHHRALELSRDTLFRARVMVEIASCHSLVHMNLKACGEVLDQAFGELGIPIPKTPGKAILDGLKWSFLPLVRMLMGIRRKNVSDAEIERAKIITQLHRYAGLHATYMDQGFRAGGIMLRSVYVLEFLPPSPERVFILINLTQSFAILRMKELALKFAGRARKVAETIGDPLGITRVEHETALVASCWGDPVASTRMYGEVYTKRQKLFPIEAYFQLSNDWSMNLMNRGYARESIEAAWIGVNKAIQIKKPSQEIICRAQVAAGQAATGQLEEASGNRKHALALLRDHPEFRTAPLQFSSFLQPMLRYLVVTEAPEHEILDVIAEAGKYNYRPYLGGSLFHCLPIFLHIAWARRALYEREPSPDRLTLWKQAVGDLTHAAQVENLRGHLCVHRAALARIEGKHKAAAKYLDRALGFADMTDNAWVAIEAELERARLFKVTGTGHQARARAVAALALARDAGWKLQAEKIAKEFGLLSADAATTSMTLSGPRTTSQTATVTLQGSMQGSLQGMNKQRYLQTLMKVSLASTGTLDPLEQARSMLSELLKLLHAERAYVLLLDPSTKKLAPYCGQTASGEALDTLDGFSQSVVAKVEETREPVILMGTEKEGLATAESVVAKGLKSVMAAPMFLRDDFVGVVCLDSQVVKGLFDHGDLEIINGISNHISIAMEMARVASLQAEKAVMKKDLELTGAVQTLFFPKKMSFTEKKITVAGAYKPAAICSGDWWWHGLSKDGKVRVMLVDVMDHGAHSAMVTAMIATLVHRGLQSGPAQGVPEMLQGMSRDLYSMLGDNYYATASAIEVDPETGLMTWWAAAAPQIVIVSASGQATMLHEAGSPIGLSPASPKLGMATHQLQPGDRVHVFSDGITEIVMANGKPLSSRQLGKILAAQKSEEPVKAGQALVGQLSEMAAGSKHVDDMTMILIEFKSEG